MAATATIDDARLLGQGCMVGLAAVPSVAPDGVPASLKFAIQAVANQMGRTRGPTLQLHGASRPQT